MSGFEVLKAIIFDYNGVLVDDLKFHEEAYWRAGRTLGIPVARETVRQYLSHSPEQKKKLLYGDISDETWKEISRLLSLHPRKRLVPDLFERKFPQEAFILAGRDDGRDVLLYLLINPTEHLLQKRLKNPMEYLSSV